ncbi:MAG: hypothetical protein KKH92_09705 [Firmicutes bacterium]|nr:hypothetical protein [Bacillota bacterium]
MNETKKNLEFVKNPLGIIALSLVLVEAIASLVIGLSTLSDMQNWILTIFIVVFPVFVMVIFYMLVTKHHTKLYAPSDYVKEENFISVLEFNRELSKNEKQLISLNKFGEFLSEKFDKMDYSIQNIRQEIVNTPKSLLRYDDQFQKNTDLEIESYDYKIFVHQLNQFRELISQLTNNGYNVEEYISPNNSTSKNDKHEAIWLGSNIPLTIAKPIILMAKKYNPELKYIHVSGDQNENPPTQVHDEIFIGGATTAALRMNLGEFTDKDFRDLENSNTIEEFHHFIRLKYIQ